MQRTRQILPELLSVSPIRNISITQQHQPFRLVINDDITVLRRRETRKPASPRHSLLQPRASITIPRQQESGPPKIHQRPICPSTRFGIQRHPRTPRPDLDAPRSRTWAWVLGPDLDNAAHLPLPRLACTHASSSLRFAPSTKPASASLWSDAVAGRPPAGRWGVTNQVQLYVSVEPEARDRLGC